MPVGDGEALSEVEQFASRGRYTVIPRTLVFLRHDDDLLLLKGAPTKRLWANRYNGLGGHVEPGETVAAAALREVWEEAGISASQIEDFALRALINVEGVPGGVLLCVFVGESRTREVVSSVEGELEWIPIERLAAIDLVDERRLLPRVLEAERVLFGHQQYDEAGNVRAFTLA